MSEVPSTPRSEDESQPFRTESFETLSIGATVRAFDEFKLAEKLPSIPGLCLTVLGLTHDGRETKEGLVDCIRLEPALTGKLIHLANSTRPPRSAPVATARAAAAILDLAAVRGVALGFHILGQGPEICRAFDHRRFWSRSLACAAAAEALARRFRSGDPEEAFTLGLLAQVGLLAMATVHPAEFEKVLHECEGKSPSNLVIAELRALRIHHWQVAADLLAEWGLSEAFRAPLLSFSATALENQHGPEDSTASPWLLTLALDLAEEMVGSSGAPTTGGSAPFKRAQDRDAGAQGLAEFAPAREEARKRWRELVEICGLDSKPSEGPEESTLAPSGPALETSARPGAPAVKERTRILVVDDDPGARHLIGVHLRRAGYEVLSAQDGEDGLRAAVSDSPQIVITDWLMPGLSGLDLCRALRRTEAGKKIYLVVLTSREEEESIIEGLEAGANDYLTKPFNPRILLARVNAGQRVIELQHQIETDKLVDRKRVAQMAQLTRKLRNVAQNDPLTGLPNRRHAMSQLEESWSTSSRYERPLSVVMIDIDHFKKVNDHHGHQVGDEVLRATANLLASKRRRSELVCRLGGEEFLLICPNTALAEALKCAERLRSAVEENHIVWPGFEGSVTVSLGVAERNSSMAKIDDLVNAADQAVYVAKELGRNRVAGYEPPAERALSA